MNILLTNDDGIFGPGLAALYRALTRLGKVYVVAPASEQSGVSQSLTFRHPLLVKDVFVNEKRWGWAVEGTPADCVKVGVNAICPEKPDLVVSGTNWGQNCGTNILYSGTLGGAFEGAMYHIPSFAVSIQNDERPNFERAAEIAAGLIEQIMEQIQAQPKQLDRCGNPIPQIFNINVSRKAAEMENPEICVCPMDTTPYATEMTGLSDTFGRRYYWLVPNSRARRPECATDMNGLGLGQVVVTPLRLDMTYTERLAEMESWNLKVPAPQTSPQTAESETAENSDAKADLKKDSSPVEGKTFENVPNLNMRTIQAVDVNREA